MRPVTLTVAGMRSYRAQRTLDFTDRTLMAILGDTGSGKSSLLEALYGALYGGTTWDARGLGALIADGVQTLQIELVFQARGQTYKVGRSVSRKNYPPSKHALDGPNGEHLDGETSVNARIVQLIGLTGQEFLRVVILPQGRFGQLLQGTAGERTPILRGILGLGVLDRVRDAADTQATALHTALDPIVAARARLYPQPQAIADAAAADSARHTQTVQRLGTAATELRDLDAAVRTVNATLPSMTAALDTVRSTDLAPVRQALLTAQDAGAEIGEQEQALTQRTTQLQAQELELKGHIHAAAAAGLTPAALATMTASLNHLDTALPALTEQAAEHAAEQTQITEATAALAAKAEQARAAAEAVQERTDALTALSAAATSTAETARQQAEHVAAVTAAREALAPQRDRLSTAATDTVAAALAVHAATRAVAAATSEHSNARAALTELQAATAAAHVAKQHHPGEPCPVCAQTLPATFAAPAIVGEDALAQALDAAEHAVTAATAAHRKAERAHDAQQQTLLTLADMAATAAARFTAMLSPQHATAALDRSACTAAAQAAAAAVSEEPAGTKGAGAAVNKAAATLTAALCAATGVDQADTLAASPDATPSVEDVERERVAAATAYGAAHDELGTLMTSAHRLEAETDAATDALARRRREHDTATARTAQASQALAASITGLPEMLSVPLVTALGLSCADPGVALLAAGAVPPALMTELRTQISAQQAELDRLSAARDELNAQHRTLDGHRVMLRDLSTESVDRPRAAARRSYERACASLGNLTASFAAVHNSCAALTAVGAPPQLAPVPAGLTEPADLEVSDANLLAELDALTARLDGASEYAGALLTAARDGVSAVQAKAVELLAAAATASLEELSERLAQAKLELKLSDVQRDRATAQIPVATGLDVGIDALSYQLRVLRQIKDLLSPSSFPQYVVEQRQVALLRIASSLFGKLTRDGYGFGEDFMIVDRRTGQPRPPKTLSGGETFLASLALALALVEVSNRSGGQLDCLFLDEGFGSLDSSILGEALDVLRLQATDGRLVGVISHLHAVAAELDDVLVVTKEIEGSTFRWLDTDERDAYLLDEAAAGLLS